MWIQKKKWKALEKRIADLEKEVQSQPQKVIAEINQQTKETGKSPLVI